MKRRKQKLTEINQFNMKRSRRLISKEEAASILTDSGISLSSPQAAPNPNFEEDSDEIKSTTISLCSDNDYDNDVNSNDVTQDDEEQQENDDEQQEIDDEQQEIDEEQQENDGEEQEIVEDQQEDDEDEQKEDSEVQNDQEQNYDSGENVEYVCVVKKRKRYKKGRRVQPITHICADCNKEFGGKTDLKRHMLIHSDERPHHCHQCGKSYRQAVNLKNHIITAHEGSKQFNCELCPKSFALKERLRLHMRLHSGEKPYACDLCDKSFARGGQLKHHMTTQHKSSMEQLNCPKCSSTFTTTTNLQAHMSRHESGPDHTCEICDEQLPNVVALRTHIHQMHYEFKGFDCATCKEAIGDEDLEMHMKKHSAGKMHICVVCNSFFTQKSQYNVHMRMHTGERPFHCRICYQTFGHSNVLKLHIRKHTGEKPFKCVLCKDEVCFTQLAHVKTHMKKIHKQFKPYMCEGCREFFQVKVELEAHVRNCTKCTVSVELQNKQDEDYQALSQLRFLMAVILNKISSEEKLRQLGFGKRLIDNVIISTLKLSNRTACDNPMLSEIDRMRLNVEEFLKWIVPAKTMQKYEEENLTVDTILDEIATMYMKQK